MDVSVLLERVLKKTHIDENMHLQTISEHFGDIVGNAVLPHVQKCRFAPCANREIGQADAGAEGRVFGLAERTFFAKKSYY